MTSSLRAAPVEAANFATVVEMVTEVESGGSHTTLAHDDGNEVDDELQTTFVPLDSSDVSDVAPESPSGAPPIRLVLFIQGGIPE